MTTISLSIDDQSKQELDNIAQTTNRSRSDVVRDMVAWYQLKITTDSMLLKTTPLLRKHSLETDEQIAKYADKS